MRRTYVDKGRHRLKEWIYAFIPKHVGNRFVLWVMQCMRLMQRHGNMYAASHYELNKSALLGLGTGMYAETDAPFMENQLKLGSLYIGMSTMDKAGCEVIAVYNALRALGIRGVELARLIEDFEKDGIIYSGRFGVAVKAMADRLKLYGLNVRLTASYDRMGDMLESSRAAILTLYNDRTTIGEQIHSVCITRDDIKRGSTYYIHNMYGDGHVCGPYADMDDIVKRLRGGRTAPIAMIGIR